MKMKVEVSVEYLRPRTKRYTANIAQEDEEDGQVQGVLAA